MQDDYGKVVTEANLLLDERAAVDCDFLLLLLTRQSSGPPLFPPECCHLRSLSRQLAHSAWRIIIHDLLYGHSSTISVANTQVFTVTPAVRWQLTH